MRGGDIDLRDLPWHFWLGLGLELVGGIIIVVSGPTEWIAGEIAGLCVFITGFALAATAFISGQRRDRKTDRDAEAAEAKEGLKPRKGARALGVLFICLGVLAVAVSIHFTGGSVVTIAMPVVVIILGVMYLGDRGLPARELRATGPKSPAFLRLGVHVKYFVAMVGSGVMILVVWLFKPRPAAATSEKIWWWVFIGVVVVIAIYFAAKYIWHCWIRRDYEEPRSRSF